MITTAESRRRSPMTTALIISLALHALLLALWLLLAPRLERPQPPKFDEMSAISDAIRLEKKTVPREAHPVVPQPAPHPVVREAAPPAATRPKPAPVAVAPPQPPRARPRPRPTAAHREIAHLVPRAPAEPALPAVTAPKREAAPPQSATAARTNRNAISSQQLAALDQQFRKTISQAQSDIANAPPPKQPPAAKTRYNAVMTGSLEDLRNGQGHVEVLQHWSQGAYNYYYVRVQMLYSDGYGETVNVPWPVVFPKADDPIARDDDHFYDLPRPPGYALPHPFQLSRLVCIYFHNDCEAVLQGEARNGGAPLSN